MVPIPLKTGTGWVAFVQMAVIIWHKVVVYLELRNRSDSTDSYLFCFDSILLKSNGLCFELLLDGLPSFVLPKTRFILYLSIGKSLGFYLLEKVNVFE